MKDLIERQAAIDALHDAHCWVDSEYRTVMEYDTAYDAICSVRAADPVRHGRWIYGQDFNWYTAHCSLCGYERRTDVKAKNWNMWGYCPNCGAKMDGEEE